MSYKKKYIAIKRQKFQKLLMYYYTNKSPETL